MKEIFKPIPKWGNLYEVSNLGRVKSLERLIKRRINGSYVKKERILKPSIDKDGYHKYIFRDQFVNKDFRGHVLVAMAFLGYDYNLNKNIVVDHKNNIKDDNKLENIQLLTIRNNTIKSIISKTGIVGVRYDERSCKFESRISIKKQRIHLGIFDFKEKAGKAYQKAKKLIENGITCTEIIKKQVKSID